MSNDEPRALVRQVAQLQHGTSGSRIHRKQVVVYIGA